MLGLVHVALDKVLLCKKNNFFFPYFSAKIYVYSFGYSIEALLGTIAQSGCMSDCRSRNAEFKPQLSHLTSLEIDHETISMANHPLG